ncbi:hypothetical protein ACWDT6_17065 [Nocardia grenadensis]|uniref:hypothetical protein n=1 Tax=Nocardia grenadensis TaxID=931537 RepID=UPI003D739AF4
MEEDLRARGRAPIDHALDSELPHLSPDRRRRMVELLDEFADLINVPGTTAATGAE